MERSEPVFILNNQLPGFDDRHFTTSEFVQPLRNVMVSIQLMEPKRLDFFGGFILVKERQEFDYSVRGS